MKSLALLLLAQVPVVVARTAPDDVLGVVAMVLCQCAAGALVSVAIRHGRRDALKRFALSVSGGTIRVGPKPWKAVVELKDGPTLEVEMKQ